MKLQVKAGLPAAWMTFLERKLAEFDQSKLEYFRLYDRTRQTATVGVWGRCTYPSRKQKLGYRIRCCVSIMDGAFPYPAKYAIGTERLSDGDWKWVWRADKFWSKAEAFVWVAGHEAFHWLRHSRQIPGANYETRANRYGFEWLDEWRMFIAW
jgi:hypothetical protein